MQVRYGRFEHIDKCKQMRLRDKIERSNLICSLICLHHQTPRRKEEILSPSVSGKEWCLSDSQTSNHGGIKVVNIRLAPPKRNQYMNVEGFAPFNPPGNHRLSPNCSQDGSVHTEHESPLLLVRICSIPRASSSLLLKMIRGCAGSLSLSFQLKQLQGSTMPCQASSALTRLFPSASTPATQLYSTSTLEWFPPILNQAMPGANSLLALFPFP